MVSCTCYVYSDTSYYCSAGQYHPCSTHNYIRMCMQMFTYMLHILRYKLPLFCRSNYRPSVQLYQGYSMNGASVMLNKITNESTLGEGRVLGEFRECMDNTCGCTCVFVRMCMSVYVCINIYIYIHIYAYIYI
jgi:hypothetical protein